MVYLGTKKEWDAQTCLHDILDIDNMLKPYVSNYRLNIFDYHDYSDFTVFKTANRVLFEALANAGDNKAFRKAMEKCDIYRMLSRETALAIRQLTGMTFDLDEIKCVNENGKEVYDMCKAFEDERIIGREQQIDDTTALYRANQITRIKKGSCDIETSILYSEMLTDYERIGDHLLNIAQSYAQISN